MSGRAKDALSMVNGLGKVADAFLRNVGSDLQELCGVPVLSALSKGSWPLSSHHTTTTPHDHEQPPREWDPARQLHSPDWDSFGEEAFTPLSQIKIADSTSPHTPSSPLTHPQSPRALHTSTMNGTQGPNVTPTIRHMSQLVSFQLCSRIPKFRGFHSTSPFQTEETVAGSSAGSSSGKVKEDGRTAMKPQHKVCKG